MSTDLSSTLRDAVADAPDHRVDPRAVIEEGARRSRQRARRRAGLAAGASALATVAAFAGVAVLSRDAVPEPDPAPAPVLRLDLEDATAADLPLVASTRVTWRDDRSGGGFEYDQLDGITADGLVLRSRYPRALRSTEIGLLDPRSKVTDWLPPAPGRPGHIVPLDLAADRLVLAVPDPSRPTTLVFDRSQRTWERHVIDVPGTPEVHVPPRLLLDPDDRLWIGAGLEGASGPIQWWSSPVDQGGIAQLRSELAGWAVAWNGPTEVRAHADGRVVLRRGPDERLVSERRPEGCDRLAELPDAPVEVMLAGDLPVVSYPCESDGPFGRTDTVVHRLDSRPDIVVEGAHVVATSDHHVLLTGAPPDESATLEHPPGGGTYLLDLDLWAITRIGQGPHETQAAVGAGLVLWNSPGPADDDEVYDVVWRVARIE